MPGSTFIDVNSQTFGGRRRSARLRDRYRHDLRASPTKSRQLSPAIRTRSSSIFKKSSSLTHSASGSRTLRKTTLMGIRLLVLPPDGPARRAIDVTFPMIWVIKASTHRSRRSWEARRTLPPQNGAEVGRASASAGDGSAACSALALTTDWCKPSGSEFSSTWPAPPGTQRDAIVCWLSVSLRQSASPPRSETRNGGHHARASSGASGRGSPGQR